MYISIKCRVSQKKKKQKKKNKKKTIVKYTRNSIMTLKFYLHLLNASFKHHRANCKILLL